LKPEGSTSIIKGGGEKIEECKRTLSHDKPDRTLRRTGEVREERKGKREEDVKMFGDRRDARVPYSERREGKKRNLQYKTGRPPSTRGKEG